MLWAPRKKGSITARRIVRCRYAVVYLELRIKGPEE